MLEESKYIHESDILPLIASKVIALAIRDYRAKGMKRMRPGNKKYFRRTAKEFLFNDENLEIFLMAYGLDYKISSLIRKWAITGKRVVNYV